MNRTGIAIFVAGFACSGLIIATGLGGCQSNSNTTPAGGGGDGPSGATGSTMSTGSTLTTGATGTTGSGGASTTSTSSTATGTGGGGTSCVGQDAQISDITGNKIGPKSKVELKGVVVMSQKFLVSKSKAGSCLWGLYISAPGLTETTAGSGLLALSYGTNASIAPGGTEAFCPELGTTDVVGDKLPDAAKPGDVIDIIGESDYFVLPQCATQPADAGATTVAQFQVSNVCSSTVVSTGGPVPTAHLLNATDELSLSDPMNKAFHDQWGGVKVQIAGVTAVEETVDGGMSLVNGFGDITLNAAGGGLVLPDDIYYQGYSKKTNICHAGPLFTSPTFTSISGFDTVNFCTWDFYVDNKCTDYVPASSDCTATSMCP